MLHVNRLNELEVIEETLMTYKIPVKGEFSPAKFILTYDSYEQNKKKNPNQTVIKET